MPLKVRSMVGLIPLFAVETLEPELLERLPGFKRRLEWFIAAPARPHRQRRLACARTGEAERRLLVDRRRASSCAACSRSCSTRTSSSRRTASARCRGITASTRTCCDVDGIEHRVDYEPAESTTGLFGGNSNWRGPDLVPGQLPARSSRCRSSTTTTATSFKVECPTGSGTMHDALGGRRPSSRGG